MLGTNAFVVKRAHCTIYSANSICLQAKPYLEKAMKLDPSNLEPVYFLAEILGQEKQFDKGVEM